MGKHLFLRLRVPAAILIIVTLLGGTALAEELIPVGRAVGIQIQLDGVLVAEVTDVETGGGSVAPARDAGLRAGDIIVAVNGQEIKAAADLTAAMENMTGQTAQITVRRDGTTQTYTVTPARGEDGTARLGLWLRDGVAGIGTVTYIDPDTGAFGALGHGVNDVETGVLLPVGDGFICSAQIADVKRGAAGAPGELSGCFDPGDVIGRISGNTVCGIFGVVTEMPAALGHAVPVAEPEEIEAGPATILACVAGQQVAEYTVEISRTGMAYGSGRDLMVHVTDPTLLELTGGIVQGMSGSPILQNGKLVGAVTHVLVNDPTQGYGIFIGSMLQAAA